MPENAHALPDIYATSAVEIKAVVQIEVVVQVEDLLQLRIQHHFLISYMTR